MEADEKKCPRCAETVKREAYVCRFCQFQFPTAPRDPSWTGFGIVVGVVAFLALASWLAPATSSSTEPSDPIAQARDPAPCDRAMEQAQRDRVVRRVRRNRIDVEDVPWRLAAAEDKRALMLLFQCSYLRGRPPAQFDDFVVAYGYRSGHRVAMASQYGVNLE